MGSGSLDSTFPFTSVSATGEISVRWLSRILQQHTLSARYATSSMTMSTRLPDVQLHQ